MTRMVELEDRMLCSMNHEEGKKVIGHWEREERRIPRTRDLREIKMKVMDTNCTNNYYFAGNGLKEKRMDG